MYDRPANLVDLAAVMTSPPTNILNIHYGRTFTSASFRMTDVKRMVETRGVEAPEALLQAIAAKGYQARHFPFQ